MKKFFIALALSILAVSCKERNDELKNISDISTVAIDSIKVPQDTVSMGSAITIKTYTTMQSGCESFYRFNYHSDGFTKEITAQKLRLNTNCGNPVVVTGNFSFAPQAAGNYTLKFKNSSTADTWISHKIVVK